MKILFVFGTRPEAIKLAPLIKAFQLYPKKYIVKICVSAQHREMLHQVLEFFDINPDFNLNIMKPDQNLFDITAETLKAMKHIIFSYKPDWIIVQGDTTTTLVGALAAFYEKVSVAHIEAGLRSFNKYSPFPEEINRVLTTGLSDLHFAHTQQAKANLLKESVPENKIFVVGNTVIDALSLCIKKISRWKASKFKDFEPIDFRKKIVLVTGHRRESFGEPLRNICLALKKIALINNVAIVYPVHLNPNVRKPVFDILKDISHIHLLEPLSYPAMVWLMRESYIVLTDSGGIQEEAPSLGKPVLVMRDVTERTEGIEAGTVKLVGTDVDKIVNETRRLLVDQSEYLRMAKTKNPYGDGKASERIVKIFRNMYT
jgi:UDP-N-acetylglucosamine 2-epimerase (non-hydrolysing)